jgi:predicted DNA-binding transcriptional regulator YafY
VLSTFRISRIKSVAVVQDVNSTLTTTEVDEITRAISERGVQFLREDICDITVKLTGRGINLFKTMSFQRPAMLGEPRSVEGGAVYRFRCTRVQADYYFFKFGAEAHVLEPVELGREFAERYRRAAEAYSAAVITV